MCVPIFLSRGDHCTVQADNVCATVWLDQKNVMFMSTGFDPTSMGQVLRRQKDGTRVLFPVQLLELPTTSTWVELTWEISIVVTIMLE